MLDPVLGELWSFSSNRNDTILYPISVYCLKKEIRSVAYKLYFTTLAREQSHNFEKHEEDF